MNRTTRMTLIALIAVASAGCDQAVKHLARARLDPSETITLLSGALHLELAHNRGGFLSLGAELPDSMQRLVFRVAVPLILVGLAAFALRVAHLGRHQAVGIALLLGGGIGNGIDRMLRDGAVTDFVRLSIGPVSTGIFNLSDVAIALGAGLFAFARRAEAGGNPARPPAS